MGLTYEPGKHDQTSHDTQHYLRINELKNYIYCPRISFYTLCLRLDRETGLSRSGIEMETETKVRMKRRLHALHRVKSGQRHFDQIVISHTLQVIGRLDEIVETPEGLYLIDYKDAVSDHGYWEIQMGAYWICSLECFGRKVLGQYVYDIGSQSYKSIQVTERTKIKVHTTIEAIHNMIKREVCPPPTNQVGKCNVCQYLRFCNDIF